METTVNSPLTDNQLTPKQVAKLDTGGVVAIPASWDDFLNG